MGYGKMGTIRSQEPSQITESVFDKGVFTSGNLARAQAFGHQLDHGDVDHGFARI